MRAVSRAVIWLLLRLLPPQRHAVVHGWPDGEGNAVELVRGLRRRYTGRVIWLLEDLNYSGPASSAAELAADSSRIVRVRKRSLRAVLLALTAEATFFTHGLFTAVRPPANRLVVNLWHGDGPKSSGDTSRIRSTVVVSGARLWADYKADAFALPRACVALVGNPRTDQFAQEVPDAALRTLGLTPDRPVVLWLPTYRRGHGPRAQSWQDGQVLSRSDDVRALATALHAAAQELGVQLVVKPHPLDGDSYAGLGPQVLTGQQLDAAGVSLYQLLGRAQALISDVSSVWVDYLVLDRPVAFYLPDLKEVIARRGLNVEDLLELLPGPQLETPDDAVRFIAAVAGAAALRPRTFPAYGRIRPEPAGAATDRLLDWLTHFQVRRGRRPLFRLSSPAAAGRVAGPTGAAD